MVATLSYCFYLFYLIMILAESFKNSSIYYFRVATFKVC